MDTPAKIKTYKDLLVYQKAKELTKEVIQYFAKFRLPKSEEFVIIQLLRAVASIGANIAEGYGRLYKKSYRQFLSISRGSSFETDYWLEIVMEFEEFDKGVVQKFSAKNIEIIKMLTTMMKRLEQRPKDTEQKV
jgi:four helix bundle protein